MNKNSIFDVQYFQKYVTMIPVSELQEQIEMALDEQYLEQHNYEVWPASDGYFKTYLPDEASNGNRRLIKAKTEAALNKKIIAFYKDKVERPCFREVYEQWIAEKKMYGEVRLSTILRYQTDFERFFPEDEPFCKIPLCDMTDVALKDFIKRQISDKGLTKKTYGLFCILLNGVFKYAKEHGFTTFSISVFMDDLVLPKSIFKKKVRNEALEVFNDTESEIIILYLLDNPTPVNLGLVLCFFTGVRVGEVSALKAEDNISAGKLLITRTETTGWSDEKGKRVTYVSDFPKTESGFRTIPLPEEGQKIFDRLKEMSGSDEYLFMKDGKRITERMFNYYLQKACREVDITPRSTHKIRKTYISKLLSEAVDSALVAKIAGHSNVNTTQTYYHRVTSTDEAQYNMVNNALKYVS